MKTPSLKRISETLNVPIKRSGDITGKVGRFSVIAFCNSMWKRRALSSIRLFCGQRVTQPGDAAAIVSTGKRLAESIGFPVDVEACGMLLTVTPDGKIARHFHRHIVKPKHALP